MHFPSWSHLVKWCIACQCNTKHFKNTLAVSCSFIRSGCCFFSVFFLEISSSSNRVKRQNCEIKKKQTYFTILWVFEQLMCAHLGGTAANCSISPHLGTWCFGESASPFARLFSSGHPPQAHNSTSLYHSHATGCHNHQHYATSMGLIYKSGHGTSSAPRGKHEAVCYHQAYLSL